jgi:hypothetical protein
LLSMGLQYAPTSGIPPIVEWLSEFQEQEHGRTRQEGWRVSVTAGSQDAIYKVRPAMEWHLSLIRQYPRLYTRSWTREILSCSRSLYMRTQDCTLLVFQSLTFTSGVIPMFLALRCEMIGKFMHQGTCSCLSQRSQRSRLTRKDSVLRPFARFLRVGLRPNRNPKYYILSRCVMPTWFMVRYRLENSTDVTRLEQQRHSRGARRF